MRAEGFSKMENYERWMKNEKLSSLPMEISNALMQT